MQQATTSPATLDELVFVGRNQAYGVFDLRQHYRPTLSRALRLGIGLFLLSLTVFGQQIKPDLYQDVFTGADHLPTYPGGFQAMRRHLEKQLHYPGLAAKLNVSGKVYVSFVVETNGQLTQLEVLKGLGFDCDEEALRVVRTMPRWKPGTKLGQVVRVRYNLPIMFVPK